MTDMIRRKQNSACLICILASNYTNTCDAAKQQFHQQRCGAVGESVKVRAHPVTIAEFQK